MAINNQSPSQRSRTQETDKEMHSARWERMDPPPKRRPTHRPFRHYSCRTRVCHLCMHIKVSMCQSRPPFRLLPSVVTPPVPFLYVPPNRQARQTVLKVWRKALPKAVQSENQPEAGTIFNNQPSKCPMRCRTLRQINGSSACRNDCSPDHIAATFSAPVVP